MERKRSWHRAHRDDHRLRTIAVVSLPPIHLKSCRWKRPRTHAGIRPDEMHFCAADQLEVGISRSRWIALLRGHGLGKWDTLEQQFAPVLDDVSHAPNEGTRDRDRRDGRIHERILAVGGILVFVRTRRVQKLVVIRSAHRIEQRQPGPCCRSPGPTPETAPPLVAPSMLPPHTSPWWARSGPTRYGSSGQSRPTPQRAR